MENNANNFVSLAEIGIHDSDQRAAVSLATGRAHLKRINAMYAHGQAHGEALRAQAAEAKRRALRNLPELLEQAEANLIANGFHVLWAADSAEAHRHIQDIVQRHTIKTVAKSKSMMTEEIALNPALAALGVQVTETDLGEFIIQLNDEPPSHIIAPVIHKTKPQIRDIFVRELGMTPTDDAGEMVAFARHILRDKFVAADMGISGGNFIIAQTGSLCLVTNEGNGRLCTSLPDVHVAFVGIEKLVETVEDYATLVQVLARSGTGQNLTVYNNIINGPRRDDEADGPRHVYVILVDNGRSDIYTTDYAEVLACVRCGACQNACPVYRNTGGHAYGWVYGGPIGAVVTPLLVGIENARPLPHASSLCGACKQVCPVDIDLPRMLLDLRHDLVTQGHSPRAWNIRMKMWAAGNRSPHLFRWGGRAARFGRNRLLRRDLPGILSNWTRHRDFPQFAEKPFRQLWQERQKSKKS